jgi:hypothetical protein
MRRAGHASAHAEDETAREVIALASPRCLLVMVGNAIDEGNGPTARRERGSNLLIALLADFSSLPCLARAELVALPLFNAAQPCPQFIERAWWPAYSHWFGSLPSSHTQQILLP